MNQLSRNRLLLGDKAQDLLEASSLLVVGIGGVGGYVVECLVRAGVGAITMVDGDVVDITNINRQIIATHSAVGRLKTEVMAARVADINPSCRVRIFTTRYNANSAVEILSDRYDYVADAIDSIIDKTHLIVSCHRANVPIISALGAGNRLQINCRITDIYQTSNDPLARSLRQRLKKESIVSHKVCCSDSLPVTRAAGNIGSISYCPALMGATIAQQIIGELIDKC